ncbi:hypothetical protein HXA34_16015 [Salipaludibacillus agaradhaerens]|jgi:hypothetical protein|uniref:DUF6612 family protein n=1 Tax=Salipaludibacillus agaradhaerens TaxID=76935 RepID=UPI002151C205|nr:DUF6612 family protein [Salipaludibacillus agaradhaerens]MCR6107812.1 hypothetical protein [Salipaludibacillus agaradhaerens]MCR6119841.1 hypothetical protein [Salipaludibacillus agaradhaerens]
MKKSLLTSLAAVTLLSLAACGDTTSDDGLSVEEILSESISTMEELDSYTLSMEMAQTLEGENEEGELESMSFDTSSEVSLTLEPMTMEIVTRMDMGELGLGEDTNMEFLSYFTEEDGFYIEDPTLGGWVKMGDDFSEDLTAISEMQTSPEDQLKSFEDNITNLSVETTDSSYIISLDGDDLDMNDFLNQLDDLGFDDMGPALEELNEMDMDIENISYKITIDKETFYQTEANIDMTYNMTMMGETISTSQQIHMVLSDFNNIDPIQIPEDVLEEAEELNF